MSLQPRQTLRKLPDGHMNCSETLAMNWLMILILRLLRRRVIAMTFHRPISQLVATRMILAITMRLRINSQQSIRLIRGTGSSPLCSTLADVDKEPSFFWADSSMSLHSKHIKVHLHQASNAALRICRFVPALLTLLSPCRSATSLFGV